MEVWRHMIFTPSPFTNCHAFSDPLPMERDILMDGPILVCEMLNVVELE